jgi:hypothetical protein
MKGIAQLNISAADASVLQNGQAVKTLNTIAISAQAILTGAPVGALTLQASNDIFTTNNQAPVNWTTIAGSSVAVGAAGTFLIPKTDLCYSAVRVVYTPTSGTGTVTVNIKVLGF